MNKVRKSRIGDLSRQEVILLIQFVEAEPIIWDLSHKKHFDAVCLKKTWEDIAAMLEKDVNSCKNGWKSLKDSKKYYCKAKQMKSGSSGGVPLEVVSKENVLWEYAPYMEFLPNVSTQRRTYHSAFEPESYEEESVNCSMLEAGEDFDEQIKETTYTYDEKRPARKRKASEPSTSQQMCEMLGNFFGEQKENSPMRPILSYWDSELKMLSPEDAADIEQKLTKLLWTEKSCIALGDKNL